MLFKEKDLFEKFIEGRPKVMLAELCVCEFYAELDVHGDKDGCFEIAFLE